MSLKVIQTHGNEIVSTQECREQCYIIGAETTQDKLLDRFARAARQSAENYLWMAIVEQTYEQKARSFSDFYFQRLPVQEVISVQYLKNGDYVTLDESKYIVDHSEGLLELLETAPEVPDRSDAVRVVYRAGIVEESALLYDDIRTAILMHVKFMYDNRDAVMVSHGALNVIEPPMSYKWLLEPYSRRRFV